MAKPGERFDMDNDSESWRSVVGFENRYEVSDHGRVRSLDRIIDGKDGRRTRWPGRILKLAKGSHGYPMVSLG